MPALNWERDRSSRLPKDLSSDFPPLTGSFEDQRRYGVFPGHQRRQSHQPSLAQVRNRQGDFHQLHLYTVAIAHPDFLRKGHPQRAELIGVLRKMIVRCEVWGACPETDAGTLKQARAALKKRMQ